MEPARSIGRLGFRRWYERQLLEGFAWLTTCLLCGFLFLAVLEIIGLHTLGITPLITLGFLYAFGLMGYKSWQRFMQLLMQAQHYANFSTCAKCDCYGRFSVLAETARMRVQCRRCGNEWTVG